MDCAAAGNPLVAALSEKDKMKRYLLVFLLIGSLHADVLFNFDSDAVGTAGPFTDTGTGSTSGVTATFTNTYAGSSASVVSAAFFNLQDPYTAFYAGGNALAIPPFPEGGGSITITFNQDISSISFDLGSTFLYGLSTFSVWATEDGTPTSVVVPYPYLASIGGGFYFAKVTPPFCVTDCSITGEFNSLTIETNNPQTDWLDNIDVVTTASLAPEPSSLGLFSAACFLIGLGCWRFKK
jgi:hypothetical protein